MTDAGAPRPGYDAIAHLYDVDMARNMPFDDVSLYERICSAGAGPVLSGQRPPDLICAQQIWTGRFARS